MLDNFSVSKKLSLGFGILLLLIIIVISITMSAIGQIEDVNKRVEVSSQLNRQVLMAAMYRQQFMRTQDTQYSDSSMNNWRGIDTLLKDNGSLFDSKENSARVAQLKTITTHFIEQFQLLIDTVNQQKALAASWSEDGKQMNLQLDKLNTDMQTARHTGAATEAQIQLSNDLEYQLLNFRYVVRAFRQNEAPLSKVDAAFSAYIDTANQLLGQLTDQKHELLQNALISANSYMSKVRQYPALHNQIDTIQANLEIQAAQFRDLIGKMNTSLVERRHSQSATAQLEMTLLAVISIVISLFATWFISRQITHPLHQALSMAQRIADGDLTGTVHVQRTDELGKLMQAMQRMNDNLHDVIGHVRKGTLRLASSAEELSAVSTQNSAGAITQKQETEQVATAMHQMTLASQEVARHTGKAADAATQADQLATHAEREVQISISQIEKLNDEMSQSATSMQNVLHESEKIGGVLDVIKTVADQTNLLALNAAIEAARAGNMGRGFAVVADEVRNLAQRTQNSTQEIETLISHLQNVIRQAAAAVGNSQVMTSQVVDGARTVGQRLAEITNSVNNIQEMNQQIATAAEEQTTVADDINRNIVNVRDSVDQFASATEQTTASSHELARLGTELQHAVERFKVSAA